MNTRLACREKASSPKEKDFCAQPKAFPSRLGNVFKIKNVLFHAICYTMFCLSCKFTTWFTTQLLADKPSDRRPASVRLAWAPQKACLKPWHTYSVLAKPCYIGRQTTDTGGNP